MTFWVGIIRLSGLCGEDNSCPLSLPLSRFWPETNQSQRQRTGVSAPHERGAKATRVFLAVGYFLFRLPRSGRTSGAKRLPVPCSRLSQRTASLCRVHAPPIVSMQTSASETSWCS